MKKFIILFLIHLVIAGIIWANDVQQPINNKAIIPLTTPEHLKIAAQNRNNDKPYVPDWEFIQYPTTIEGFTNYYDYMPGSYCGRSIARQTDIFGGVYFVFHGRPSTTANRRIYWAYVHPGGAIVYGTITNTDTWQGYPGMTMHAASGDPIATWHDNIASIPYGSCTCVSYDDYALLHIPGFWKDPVIFDQPESHVWPNIFVGKSPDYSMSGNFRLYQISSSNPDGEIEHSILRWIDVPQDNWIYGDLNIMLDKDNWAPYVNIFRDWSDPDAGLSCRPYPSFTVDPFNAGHVAIFGYAGYTTGLMGLEVVPQGFYVWDSYDGGETWDYDNFHSYQTDVGMLNEYVLYAVENVPGFVDDNGVPYDSLHVWIGWPGSQHSTHRTATFDSQGNLHLPELFWISYVDGAAGSASYWPYYVFQFQAEVVYKADGTWDIRHVANMPGIDAWTGHSVPWEIHPLTGDTLVYPWCDMAYTDITTLGFHENTQRQAVNFENDWMVQVWASGTKLLYAENGPVPIPGYDGYLNHPIIHVSVSKNNGEYWSAPIELSDIYSTAFPGFADMITVYPCVNPTIKDLGDGWGQIDMYFFNDNDYGSSILGMGPTTGGEMVYCSFKINFFGPGLSADFSADPLSGYSPLTVQFTDQSWGIISSWAWDFDYDGTIDSYEQNPQWTYNNSGTYTVRLTVSDGKSKATDTEIKVDYITVNDSVNIINVPGDYSTIQEGIDAASNGDIVLVQPGTYVENINYNGKNITVASLYLTTQDTSYISQTVIDGDSLDSVVKFLSEEDSTAMLCGFTITNGNAYSGAGIFCIDSSPHICNMNINGNNAVNGGGVRFIFSSSTFENIKVSGNNASIGGGIYFSFSTPFLDKVKITNNCAESGGGMYCYESSPIANNILIVDNSASQCGGGICCYYCCSPYLENVTITNNQGYGYGAGIYTSNYSYPTIINCIVSDNIGNYGIYNNSYHPGNPTTTYSDVWNNESGNFYNCTPGIGCLSSNPLFVNPLNGDYHLSWINYPIPDSTKSPCIDAGDPSSPLDPDGTITDMGAYYFNQNVSIDEPIHSSKYELTIYPNPINTNTNNITVSFSIRKTGNVKIQLFNIKGQLVSTLINEDKNIGDHTITCAIDNLSSGIYFTKLSIDGVNKEIRKVILLK